MEKELKYFENVTQEEAVKKAKELNGRILTNKEIDNILQEDIENTNPIYRLNKDVFPLWTGTKVTYDESGEGTIEEEGKTHKLKLPKENGYYEQDEFGLPTKEKSESSNKKARYLYRRSSKHSCLVARDGGYFGYDGRDVYCLYEPTYRFGVLIEIQKK